MNMFLLLKRTLTSGVRSEQLLAEIREGIANLGRTEQLLEEIRAGIANLGRTEQLLAEMKEGIANLPGSEQSRDDLRSVEIFPIQDVPFPEVSFEGTASILEITKHPIFDQCVDFFSRSPSASRSLVSPHLQALLFSLVRNIRPRHAFEIGTYRAATSEAICRALQANGTGQLHTIDPYGADSVPPILMSWPKELRRYARFYALDSMLFFERMNRLSVEPDIVFIDGNHDYEFAAFDIEAASRIISPGGVIVIDNISQPGPFLAARDFLKRNPDWADDALIDTRDANLPYDSERTSIRNTDCSILIRPSTRRIQPSRPETTGQLTWKTCSANGIDVAIDESASGVLTGQCILRGFGDALTEKAAAKEIELKNASGLQRLVFDSPLEVSQSDRYTIEVWLTWRGNKPLELTRRPSAFCD
jgi:predicted O-methyltransferase YrrM